MRRREIHEVQKTLKELMALSGFSLQDMAKKLDISIATAKRVLNGDDLSVDRLIQICHCIDYDFYDVMELARNKSSDYQFCSVEQEDFLANHPGHFAFLRALQKDYTVKWVEETFELESFDVARYLKDLEAEGFLERLPGERVKLLVKDGMDWRPGGSLWKNNMASWIQQFTGYVSEKIQQGQKMTILDLSQKPLSKQSIQQLKDDIDTLSKRYAALSKLERKESKDLQEFSCMIVGDDWFPPMLNVPRIFSGND